MFPLGRGQRELVVGDAGIGKQTLVKGAIIIQKRANRFHSPDGQGRRRLWSVYSCLGSRGTKAIGLSTILKRKGSMWYNCIMKSDSGDTSALQHILTFESCSVSECFRDCGQDIFIIYDNMNNHAVAYRQMALLLKNAPGREAYPGDIFFQHARLLERAAQMARRFGYGSLSAFPLYETQREDITTYICTNLISITDGQIYLTKKLFNRGIKPAVDIYKSVSRVGTRAQPALLT
jgi:F-type H+-transporting ATPase subunit alpha